MTDPNEPGTQTEPPLVPNEQTVNRLSAENERLRRRVDELESALGGIEDRLDAETAVSEGASTDGSDTAKRGPPVTSGGQPTKVVGILGDEDGIGVYGSATGDGATVGVRGEVLSNNGAAIEAFGNDGKGIEAVSTGDHAIRAANQTQMDTVRAVNSGTADGARAVFGETEDSDEGIGIHGRAVVPEDGAGYGVSGEIAGDGEGYGLHTPDDASIEGDIDVGGEVVIEPSGLLSVSVLRFGGESTLSYNNSLDRFQLSGAGHFEASMDIRVNDPTTQRTAGPIAKGAVNIDDGLADLQNAVNIESVTWRSGENDFEVELAHVDEFSFAEFAVQVMPTTPIPVGTGTSDDDNLTLEFEGGAQMPFQVVVWELPDGQETTSEDSAVSTG